MENRTLKNRFDKYLIERKAIHLNDSFAIYKKWDELTELLSENEKDTIKLIRNASKEEIDWISEVMEDVSLKLKSTEYIKVLQEVHEKYPACNLEDIISLAIEIMNKK